MAPPRKTQPPAKDAPAWQWYYWHNKKAVLQRQKERYERNKQGHSKMRRSYYERNREKVLAYQNAYNRRKRGPLKTDPNKRKEMLDAKAALMRKRKTRIREARKLTGHIRMVNPSLGERHGKAMMSLAEKKKHLQERGLLPPDPKPHELP